MLQYSDFQHQSRISRQRAARVLRGCAPGLIPGAGERGKPQGLHLQKAPLYPAALAGCFAEIAAFEWRQYGETRAKTAKRGETIAALWVKLAK
ncbi:hypothetical protein LCL97_01400 [Seohaeicola saemankumensis]|nr:hypothetical protein [Seohaeicola saemankumensis]MCA0869468.1 hypothetical protein [Seohaeicola saemankumensis]